MSDWRPFEPSLDAIKAAEREAAKNKCNLHKDCAAADAACKAAGGRKNAFGDLSMRAVHCDVSDCEDCFGC